MAQDLQRKAMSKRRKPASKKKKAGRVLRIAIFLILIIAGALTSVYFVLRNYLKIQNIEVAGSSIYSKEEILNCVSFKVGDKILAVKIDKEEENLLKLLPYSSEINIKLRLPGTIVAEVVPANTLGVFYINNYYFVVNEKLKVMEITEDQEKAKYPSLSLQTEGEAAIGENITLKEPSLFEILTEVRNSLEKNEILEKVTGYSIKSKYDISASYENKYEIKFGNKNEIDKKVKFAIEIMKNLRETDKGIIDVQDLKVASFKPVYGK